MSSACPHQHSGTGTRPPITALIARRAHGVGWAAGPGCLKLSTVFFTVESIVLSVLKLHGSHSDGLVLLTLL